MESSLRPSQIEILNYSGGTMGISAVPGSGKTFILSALAAKIITEGWLNSDQEVLIVTLVNSAVDNFTARIARRVQNAGLIPHLGYRVRTLHGLAHDIVREKPTLAGLDERFQIVDEIEAERIRSAASQAWARSNPDFFEDNDWLLPGLSDGQRARVRQEDGPRLVDSIASAFIRRAKDLGLSPERILQRAADSPQPLPLAEMGAQIYSDYQRALAYRGAVDFDDLIRLANLILEQDPEYLARLQHRFPYILEDEAQDSSHQQQTILAKLAGPARNWVRVGDPNQAIYETFTNANPQYLRDFIAASDAPMALPVSGRSQTAIIELANHLVRWTIQAHPIEALRMALSEPYICPTEAGDPQPNPPLDWAGVKIINKKMAPEEEVQAVVKSLEKWLPDHPEDTVAVISATNDHAAEVVRTLKAKNMPYVEMLKSTSGTRMAAGALANVLNALADPGSPSRLARAYQVWRRAWRESAAEKDFYTQVSGVLRKAARVEDYLYPLEAGEMPGSWWAGIRESESAEIQTELESFAEVMRRWQGTTLLPIDQMVLTLAQELFSEPADLALAHKLALVLRQLANDHADWRLPQLTDELGVIAKNERRFIGFSADDAGFDPQRHKGKVVVTTMHKAKGLEWDRVYLLSLNTYDFPGLAKEDRFISEKWFLRGLSGAQNDHLNLEAEAIEQLRLLAGADAYHAYEEGAATLTARVEYARERLRLLYVGITRARRELVLTWNSGRRGDSTACQALDALDHFFSR